MMIDQLEPKLVWKNFAKLNAVPRPSKKEERVINFMLDFGKSLNLETFSDVTGNVIIRKKASKGMEDRKMVTLQSHLDMVHQKNTDTVFNFEEQGIDMLIDGDWVMIIFGRIYRCSVKCKRQFLRSVQRKELSCPVRRMSRHP